MFCIYFDLVKVKCQHNLESLRDVTHNIDLFELHKTENVFQKSLLRDFSPSIVFNQYKRVLEGGVKLSDFEFSFSQNQDKAPTNITIDFKVKARSKPPSNIHILIGRNGVGKTSILKNMVTSVLKGTSSPKNDWEFYDLSKPLFNTGKKYRTYKTISIDYFPNVLEVSFSAFDLNTPLPNQTNKLKGTCYYYIGLKQNIKGQEGKLKDLEDLSNEFSESVWECLNSSNDAKKERWLDAITKLESDVNFANMSFRDLKDYKEKSELKTVATKLFTKLSSGHAIVLLTTTTLVAKMEERTLVLIDEPESHLHPPLLSAFIRALSDLLIDRNGVAIIATHSPVVLQEVPKSCVWILSRAGLSGKAV